MTTSPARDWWAPLWRRVGAVLLGVVWATVEWRLGNRFLFCAAALLTVVSTYEFFLTGHYRQSADPE